ncbi:TadE/TadG family type IV pilus assembly protein [Sphingomonas sp. Leaf412]|uniref:TadE/TadG family type IV pilus assembly protein n=1 Tax=Sphingomonas sp. Leaf412 TaxID=1736370 RepID=UPI001F3E3C4F|nr:histidine kinase [Sphingomonas sp. Leaf412]
MTRPPSTFVRVSRALLRDRSGVALIEFAFSMPIVLGIGCYGIETANLALANLRVSQIALNLADNASRVGNMQADNTTQLREVDINDALTAARMQGEKWGLTTQGRVTLSSLEEHGGKQYIHWQRCLGTKSGSSYDSRYGTTKPTDGTAVGASYAGTEVTGGMGKTGAKVSAPPDSGVMFVEVNYDYSPVIGKMWLAGEFARLHYIASFVVRDRRAFDQIYNPAPTATRYTCDRYTSS